MRMDTSTADFRQAEPDLPIRQAEPDLLMSWPSVAPPRDVVRKRVSAAAVNHQQTPTGWGVFFGHGSNPLVQPLGEKDSRPPPANIELVGLERIGRFGYKVGPGKCRVFWLAC